MSDASNASDKHSNGKIVNKISNIDDQKSSKLSNFLGKAKSKVKIFNGNEAGGSASSSPHGTQNHRERVKNDRTNGVVTKVKNFVSNKSSNLAEPTAATPSRRIAKVSTATTPKKQQSITFPRCVSEPSIQQRSSTFLQGSTSAISMTESGGQGGGPSKKRRMKIFRRNRNLVNPSSSSSSTAGSTGGSRN